MCKNWLLNPLISLCGTAAIAACGFIYHKVDAHTDQIAKLDKKIAIMATFLNDKFSKTNLAGFLTMSASKDISALQAATAIQLFEHNPDSASAYLKSELHFDEEEIQSLAPYEKINTKNFP